MSKLFTRVKQYNPVILLRKKKKEKRRKKQRKEGRKKEERNEKKTKGRPFVVTVWHICSCPIKLSNRVVNKSSDQARTKSET